MKQKSVVGQSSTDKQPRISSFFHQPSSVQEKRSHSSTIDLTSDDEQPPIKKLKVGKGKSLVDQWRFGGSQTNSVESPIIGEEDVKRKRHEEFKRVLLAENSSFARRESQQDMGSHPSDDESSRDQEDVYESEASDEAFKDLRQKFSNKSTKATGKARFRSSAKGKGTSEELGPSGQSYTPSELQVCLLHVCMFLLTTFLVNLVVEIHQGQPRGSSDDRIGI